MTTKFPSTIGACIDALYVLRAKRLAGQKEVDKVKAEEAMYEEHILNNFTKTDLRGAKGDIATAAVKSQLVYNIEDWDSYIDWVEKEDARDCLQKRLSQTAIAARFDNGEVVPGVTAFTRVTLSLTKAGG